MTGKQASTASSGERLHIRQQRSGQHRNREEFKRRNNRGAPTHASRSVSAEDRAEMNESAFLASASEVLARTRPSPKDLGDIVDKSSRHATKRGQTARRTREKASEINQFEMSKDRARTPAATEWTDGGHGWIAETKPS